MDFLDLPSKTRALINMSGGQQRRHSALKSEKKVQKSEKKKFKHPGKCVQKSRKECNFEKLYSLPQSLVKSTF